MTRNVAAGTFERELSSAWDVSVDVKIHDQSDRRRQVSIPFTWPITPMSRTKRSGKSHAVWMVCLFWMPRIDASVIERDAVVEMLCHKIKVQ